MALPFKQIAEPTREQRALKREHVVHLLFDVELVRKTEYLHIHWLSLFDGIDYGPLGC